MSHYDKQREKFVDMGSVQLVPLSEIEKQLIELREIRKLIEEVHNMCQGILYANK